MYIVYEVTKDVMTLDFQQCRISALFSASFFASVCFDSQKAEKCDTFVRKPYFLRPWGAKVLMVAAVVRSGELLFRTASGAKGEKETQEFKKDYLWNSPGL